jgi:hypothetical protein
MPDLVEPSLGDDAQDTARSGNTRLVSTTTAPWSIVSLREDVVTTLHNILSTNL